MVRLEKSLVEVDKQTLERWNREACEWAKEAKKKIIGRDLPPGFDPDDEHKYILKLPPYGKS